MKDVKTFVGNYHINTITTCFGCFVKVNTEATRFKKNCHISFFYNFNDFMPKSKTKLKQIGILKLIRVSSITKP